MILFSCTWSPIRPQEYYISSASIIISLLASPLYFVDMGMILAIMRAADFDSGRPHKHIYEESYALPSRSQALLKMQREKQRAPIYIEHTPRLSQEPSSYQRRIFKMILPSHAFRRRARDGPGHSPMSFFHRPSRRFRISQHVRDRRWPLTRIISFLSGLPLNGQNYALKASISPALSHILGAIIKDYHFSLYRDD